MITVYDMTSGEFLECCGQASNKADSHNADPSTTYPAMEAIYGLHTPGVDTGLQEIHQENQPQTNHLPTELVNVDCEHFISSMDNQTKG